MFQKKIYKSEFNRNVFTIVSGTTISQAIAFLLTPVISRLYTPADYGVFALFISIASGISVIACGRFELGIVLSKDENEAKELVSLATCICVATSIITFLITLFVLLVFPGYSYLFLCIPFLVFLLGIYQIHSNWALKQKGYKTISLSRVLNTSLNSITAVFIGLIKPGAWGLLAGVFTGQGIANLFLNKTGAKPIANLRDKPWKDLKNTAIKYKSLAQTNTLQALNDMLQVNGIVYLIPFFFNSYILGLFSFSMRLLQVPISFIGSAMSMVFYQSASERFNKMENLHQLVKTTILQAFIIALPIPFTLFFYGPEIFSLIFGLQWFEAGEYAKILSPWLFFDFIRSTVSQLAIIINKQKKLFYLSFFGNINILISIIIGGLYFNDIKITLIILSITQSILMLIILKWFYDISKRNQVTSL